VLMCLLYRRLCCLVGVFARGGGERELEIVVLRLWGAKISVCLQIGNFSGRTEFWRRTARGAGRIPPCRLRRASRARLPRLPAPPPEWRTTRSDKSSPRRCSNSPRPEQPTILPTSYTTSWDLTLEADSAQPTRVVYAVEAPKRCPVWSRSWSPDRRQKRQR
jgi:hypothetical protein